MYCCGDCGGVTTQNDVCQGKFRVSHGGPTFIYYNNWRFIDLSSYELICTGKRFFRCGFSSLRMFLHGAYWMIAFNIQEIFLH